MSRLASNFQRASRGSSRGALSYYNAKNLNPGYGVSSKKDTKYYDTKTLKSNTPIFSSALKSSLKQKNTNIYQSTYQRTYQREKQKLLQQEIDLKRQAKQKNQNFRIRTNIKEQTITSSVKSTKDDDQRQKQMSESLKRQQTLKIEKQKIQIEKFNLLQKQSQIRRNQNMEKKIEIPAKLMPKTLGLVGLNNIGNTCFMNSILQCVFNLPGFNQYFLQDRHQKQMKSASRVADSYARTIKIIRSSTSRSETPSELKSAIGSKKSRFLGYSQQDAQEFLAALLELLSLDLNRSKNPKYKELTADTTKYSLSQISNQWWDYNKQREDSIVCDYFSGQVLSKVVCSKCHNQSIAFDNIWDMALNFTPNDNGEIMKMIENFLKEEIISSDYYCSKCKSFRECKRKIDFYRLPKILVFQLKRFSYGRWRKVKLNNKVRVPQELDLSEMIAYSQHPSVENPVYELVGVVNHSGDIDFGHYTAQCKNPINHKWYNFNDSHVSETRMRQEFESSSPYLLFYAKKS